MKYLCFLVLIIPAFSEVFIQDDFENGLQVPEQWIRTEACCVYSITIDSTYSSSGKFSLKSLLKVKDPRVHSSKRAEIVAKSEDYGLERWYRFSIFLDSSHIEDPISETVVQWHAVPDRKLGEPWRSPPLQVYKQRDLYAVQLRWDSVKVSKAGNKGARQNFKVGKYLLGVWSKFIFHVKWTYKNDGILQVWRNDSLYVDYRGPTTYNDEKGVYQKFGIYKGTWKNEKKKYVKDSLKIWYDDIVTASDSASLFVEPNAVFKIPQKDSSNTVNNIDLSNKK